MVFSSKMIDTNTETADNNRQTTATFIPISSNNNSSSSSSALVFLAISKYPLELQGYHSPFSRPAFSQSKGGQPVAKILLHTSAAIQIG